MCVRERTVIHITWHIKVKEYPELKYGNIVKITLSVGLNATPHRCMSIGEGGSQRWQREKPLHLLGIESWLFSPY
jgi:hypothetical protein